jgi:hypothetical protein
MESELQVHLSDGILGVPRQLQKHLPVLFAQEKWPSQVTAVTVCMRRVLLEWVVLFYTFYESYHIETTTGIPEHLYSPQRRSLQELVCVYRFLYMQTSWPMQRLVERRLLQLIDRVGDTEEELALDLQHYSSYEEWHWLRQQLHPLAARRNAVLNALPEELAIDLSRRLPELGPVLVVSNTFTVLLTAQHKLLFAGVFVTSVQVQTEFLALPLPPEMSAVRGMSVGMGRLFLHTTETGLWFSDRDPQQATAHRLVQLPGTETLGRILQVVHSNSATMLLSQEAGPPTLWYRRSNMMGLLQQQTRKHEDFSRLSLPPEMGSVLILASTSFYQLLWTTTGLWSTHQFNIDDGAESVLVQSASNNIELPFYQLADSESEPLQLICKEGYVLALTKRQLMAIGNNIQGQLGLSKSFNYVPVLTVVPLPDVGELLQVAGGSAHTMLLTTTGLWATGSNAQGQLGLGSEQVGLTLRQMTRVPLAEAVGLPLQVACGDESTLLLTTTGLWAAGHNQSGQFGVTLETDNYASFHRLPLQSGYEQLFLNRRDPGESARHRTLQAAAEHVCFQCGIDRPTGVDTLHHTRLCSDFCHKRSLHFL